MSILDVAEVDAWEVDPPDPLIEGIVPRGAVVNVTGDTQTGKSLFFLWLCMELLAGGSPFGRFKIHKVESILYLCLEDPEWRVKARIQDMIAGGSILPEKNSLIIDVHHNFSLTNDEHFQMLEDLVRDFQFDVVVLDTYQKATGGLSSFDDEKQGPILHRLSNLTRSKGVTIFVLDHPRKGDSQFRSRTLTVRDIKGTGGKPQNADCVILMSRRGDNVTMSWESKDYGEGGMVLKRSPEGSNEPKFTFVDELENVVEERRLKARSNRAAAVDLVKKGCSKTASIAEKLDLAESTVRKHLSQSVKEGKVKKLGTTRGTEWKPI